MRNETQPTDLSIKLIVTMDLFLNRSVKNLNLAAWYVMQILSDLQGCEIEVLNGSSFYAS